MGSMFATEQIKEAIQRHLSKVPVVIVNGYLDLPNVSGVLIDEDAGVGKCADLLISKGKSNLFMWNTIALRQTCANSRVFVMLFFAMELPGRIFFCMRQRRAQFRADMM